ncbi:MAG: SpoIIE family protein phosphatase [Bacteroidetes bacterium]|nr:SpoIIE family protein phosphatase [Bacteroidota bacterium]MBU1720198.1 SpoIIE family protein phosphatase [Bacteroidota bacterium]
MRLRLYLVLLFLILFAVSKGQHYNFTSYSIEDGLPQSQIKCIYEDSRGYLWIGTDGGGVCRFDGKEFVTYTTDDGLCENQIRAVLEDKDGNFWFGSDANYLSKFDGKKFFNFNRNNGLRGNAVQCIAQDMSGNLWVGVANDGLYQVKNDTFIKTRISDLYINLTINTIFTSRDSSIWIGTATQGIFRFMNGNYMNFTAKNGLSDRCVYSFSEDLDGNIWIGTHLGVSKVNYEDTRKPDIRFQNYSVKNGLPGKEVRQVYCDANGNIWISCFGKGIVRFDGFEFTVFNEKNGLPNKWVHTLCQDRSGVMWFGTDGAGICKFENELFKYITQRDGLQNDMVMAFEEDRHHNIWIGMHSGGVVRYDGQNIRRFSTIDGLCSEIIYSIHEDRNGDIWFGSKGDGLSILRNGKFVTQTTKDGLGSDFVYNIKEDPDGNLWICTRDAGLTIFNGKDYVVIGKEDGLPSSFYYEIEFDRKGNLWACSDDAGVIMIPAWCVKKIPEDKTSVKGNIKAYSKEQGLPHQLILSITEDRKGNLWFGTFGKGISKFDGKKFYNFSKEDGLRSDNIYAVYVDSWNNLWVGSNRGIDKISLEKSTSDSLSIQSYGRAEGFIGIETNLNAIMEDSRRQMWFGTIHGAAIYNHEDDIPSSIETKTLITKIQLRFEDTDWTDFSDSVSNWFNIPYGLELPYDKNHITLIFSGIYLKNPEKVLYQWKLEGFDKIWSPVSQLNRVTYSNLPPGEYTFRVKSCNSDGIWNDEATIFTFRIRKPFFRTWWFYIICLFGIFIGIYTMLKFRERNLRRAKYRLEDIVANRTLLLRREKMIVEKQKEEMEIQAGEMEKKNIELEKLSIVARETDNGILVAGSNGEIEWVNEGFTRLYGYTLEEYKSLVGDTLIETSSNPEIQVVVNEAMVTGKTVAYDCPVINIKGDQIWVQTTLTPILDDKGNLLKLIAIDSDITSVKLAEAEIERQSDEIRVQRDNLESTNKELLRIQGEIHEKNRILEENKVVIESKNKNITDSLRYAYRIQQSILPSEDNFLQLLPESFVLYKPKDYVSGDFCWVDKKRGKILFAAVDCTGHGVPGAFMSIIGHNLLNQAVHEEHLMHPNEILTYLSAGIYKSFKRQGEELPVKAGMDLSVCAFNRTTMILEYAGVHNPAYIVRKNEIIELKADSFPIGEPFNTDFRGYTNKRFKMEAGDVIYVFSDGFIDQPGGARRKRFQSRNFKTTLIEIAHLPAEEQKRKLDNFFISWKGEIEQYDDVLVIGIRF